jgi:hypothetical protein
MAINIQKLLPPSKLYSPAERMSAAYDKKVDDVTNLNVKRKFINVDKFLKNSYTQKKKEEDKKKRKKQSETRQEKETKLETPKGIKGIGKIKSLIPATGILDAVQKFAIFTFIGWLFTKFAKDLPKLLTLTNKLVPIANTVEKIIGGIFEGVVGFIDAGYKAYDQMRALSKDIGGEKAQKVYDDFSKNFNYITNAILTFGLSTLVQPKPTPTKSNGGLVTRFASGGQTTRGGQVVGGAIGRTFRAQSQKPKQQQKLKPQPTQPGKDVGGKKQIEKLYPNPKITDTKKPNPYKALTEASKSLKQGGQAGILMAAGVDLALGQNLDFNLMSSLSGDFLSKSKVNEVLQNIRKEISKQSGAGPSGRGPGQGGGEYLGDIEYGPLPLNMSQKQAFATIYELAKKNGDPMPELTAAQAMFESGYLSSANTKDLNNPFGQSGEGTKGSSGRWAAYNSLEDAVKDHINKWQKDYKGYKGMGAYNSPMEGLRSTIESYAPAAENDQAAYLKSVAGILATMGFDPNKKNSAVDLSTKALIQKRKPGAKGTSVSTLTTPSAITTGNGKLNKNQMIPVGTFQTDDPSAWYGNQAMLLKDSGVAFNAAVAAAAKEGIDLKGSINSAYRDLHHQEVIVGKYPVAAAPGTSQHGEGHALDINPNSAAFKWLKKNGPRYGWYWANIPGDDVHFEYKTGGYAPPKPKPKVKPTAKPKPKANWWDNLNPFKQQPQSSTPKRNQPSSRKVPTSFNVDGTTYTNLNGRYTQNGKPITKEIFDAVVKNHLNGMQGGGIIGSQNRRNYSSLSMYPSYDGSGGMMIAVQPIIVEKPISVPTGGNKTIMFPVPVSVNNSNMASLSRG